MFTAASPPPNGWHEGRIATAAEFLQPNMLHFCKLFLDSGFSFDGLNTIAHELSHVYGGTKDKRDTRYQVVQMYGVESCVHWAQANPGKTVENADSYGYFVAYYYYRKNFTTNLIEVH